MTLISSKQSIASIIKDIHRRLRNLETATRLGNSSITQGNLIIKGDSHGNGQLIIEGGGNIQLNDQGDLTVDGGQILIKNDGQFFIIDSDSSNTLIFMGAFTAPSLNKPNGKRQQGVELYRDSGEIAFSISDPLPLVDGYHQFFAFWDRLGNIVLSDDTTTGFGLSSPSLSTSVPTDSNPTTWPSTTNGTFTTVAFNGFRVTHPFISVGLLYVTDSATTGDFKVLINSTTVSSVFSAGASTSGAQNVDIDLRPFGFNSFVNLTIQARRTSGSGNVYAVVYYALLSGSP